MRRRRGRRNSSSSSSSSGSDGDDDAISEQTLPSPPVSSPERAEVILKCFLAGFAGNTARLSADGRGYATVASHQPIAIHPSSTLFGRRLEAIMYNEYVFTSRGYAKCVSAIQMSWLAEALGV
jgi:ATP-dependent RNA helicase DHR2